MSAFGQYISITQMIKNIIKDYPEGTQILKELLQNGDDARARNMTYLLDRRTHSPKNVVGSELSQWQGPALLVFDSEVFVVNDFESIQSTSNSGKKFDPTKTGKFGVGFNSVYHLTDVPSFVSGNHLCFLGTLLLS